MSYVNKNSKNDSSLDNAKNGLKRSLKNRHVQLIALGGIIGSCYFLGTGTVIRNVGPGAVFAYLLGGAALYFVMICLSELAVAMPVSGSFITYASEFVSPAWACGVGWSYFISWAVYIPSECLAAGIIMHSFFPLANQYIWAVVFGLIITFMNLTHVKAFGEIEFWLTLVKIFGLIFFSVLAIFIFFGVIHGSKPAHIIGTENLLKKGGLFPLGMMAIISNMVMLMVNYQGAEILGLTAGETKNPEKVIPSAVKSVFFQIIVLYLIPVLLLVVILPWNEANLSRSVFSTALYRYGLRWAGGFFSFITLTAAISCANSGMYASVRALYALGQKRMAPKFFTKLSKNSVPAVATIFTIVCVWIFLACGFFFSASSAFVALLSISGFTGTICSISICWSQLNFRKRLKHSGYTAESLSYKTPASPYTAHLGIWIQVICLAFSLFSSELRIAFYVGVPVLITPIILYKMIKKQPNNLNDDKQEVSLFESTFPTKIK